MAKITLLPPEILADPEVVAMIQAFYSRSSMGIEERLEELGTNLPKVKEALKKWYLGYSHDSIGDCGNVAVFFEGVSMLFAKALQDNPLYNGQETSTRFFSFSAADMVLPDLYLNGEPGSEWADMKVAWTNQQEASICENIQNTWMQFYEKNLDRVINRLQIALPHADHPGVTEIVWENSIKARAFDIMRAFLPAGTKTQLSFYGSLRNLRDSLSTLEHHPLVEVGRAASDALLILKDRYPSAFSVDKFNEEQASFLRRNVDELLYSTTVPQLLRLTNEGWEVDYTVQADMSHRQLVLEWRARLMAQKTSISCIGNPIIPGYVKRILDERPKGFKVPYHFGRHAHFSVKFFLDYGSFRDIQRHRNCKMPLPVLTSTFGMHPWYLEQLETIDANIYQEALDLVNETKEAFEGVVVDTVDKLIKLQDINPMGMQVPVEIDLALDEMFYIAELRSSKTVHPTLRPVAQAIGRYLRDTLELKVYLDESPDEFVSYRGKQTITKVEADA